MKKYLFVAVLLLAFCTGARAQSEETPSLSSLQKERNYILNEIKTLQENTLNRIKVVSPKLADKLVYEMFHVIKAYSSDLWSISSDIEYALHGDQEVSDALHQISKKRIPYESVGLIYDCAVREGGPHQVEIHVSEELYKPFYPYISKELIDFIGLALVSWDSDDAYVSGIHPNKLYPTEASYIAGLERYIKTYPKSPYLATEDFDRSYAGGQTNGIVDIYNHGARLFLFGAENNLDRPTGKYTWRAMEDYLELLPNGNLLPVIKEIRKIGHPREILDDKLLGQASKWRDLLEALRMAVPHNTIPQVEKLQAEQIHAIASKTGLDLMKFISPMSGSDGKYQIEEKSLAYDPRENMFSVRVTYTWQARHFIGNVPFDKCELSGLLTIYPPIRSLDGVQARFYYDKRNRHLMRVSEDSQWQRLAGGYETALK